MSRLTEALAQKRAEVEAPTLLPIGTFTWEVAGQYEAQETDAWDILQIPVKCIEAHEDVDEEELAEFGSVSNQRNRVGFFFPKDETDKNGEERTLFAIKQFIEACGLPEEKGESLDEGLGRTMGCQFAAPITHRQDKNDPDRVNVNIGKPVALD